MRQIGRYYVVEQLGAGAMGTVYRALDPTIGRTVAIKAIRLTEFADPAERERVRDRLLQEARSAGLLSHPNIITIYDVLEEEGSAFIVMEYVEGPSLGGLLQGGHLPESNRLLRYFGQIADALDYAHRKGVIHRDIKSANILISSEHHHSGIAKISDFGISKFISQDTTHSGTMIGTPNYMAPEQIQGLPLNGRSDQFSFAVVVYEMLTGTKPFRAESLATLFYQVCKQEPQSPHELNASLPLQVDEVIARGLAKDPGERFTSCVEFVAALGTALNVSAAWHGATGGDLETQTMSTIAGTGTALSTEALAKPTSDERKRDAPNANEPVPPSVAEYPSDIPFPPLPRRTRGMNDAEYDRGGSSWSLHNRVVLVFAGSALVVALVLLLARVLTRNPSAPVAAPQSAPQETSATTRTTDTAVRSDRPSEPQSKPAPSQAPPQTAPGGPSPNPPLGAAAPPITAPTITTPPTTLPTTAPSTTASAEVAVTTQPPGANVVIDSRTEGACHSPCTTFLPAGRHTLTAELKGFNTARRIFTVPDEKQLTVIMAPSMGVLLVTTEPAGSTVIVDGKQYGVTPINIRLPIGTHQLAIVNGSGRHEEDVQIDNDQITTRSFRWQ